LLVVLSLIVLGQSGKNGLDVSKTMKGVTLNVEKNRLDITDLHKRLVKLEQENQELKKENIKLKQRIELLEQKK
jgi:regulator of replication initiation timing